ncbi:hypothetical protein [Spirosoma luteum]|uniref:hypothetical protein n=1 Tax=Spirosoma luteum TaxID=431553 RepID=UPI00035C0D96|nr:hypothetical protein [Spirosoma luteum]
MNNPTSPSSDLSLVSLTQDPGREILDKSIAEYLAFLRRQPAFCGTPEQQENLIKHVARGQDLIKLIAAERLKITREIDHQKHDWMELEKQLVAPIESAMQPLKEAVERYNQEVVRIREHQQAEADGQRALTESADASETDWLNPDVTLSPLPKGVQMRWAFTIVDSNQVPNGYWSIDESLIKKAIADGTRDIPGIRIYQEAITTFRK